MGILKSKDQLRYCSNTMASQQQMQTQPNRFLKMRAVAISRLVILRELLKWLISLVLLFLIWCPLRLSSFQQSLLLLMQIILLIGQKLRNRYSPKFSLTIYSRDREELGQMSDSPKTTYYSGSGQTETYYYETFLLAGDPYRPSLPPNAKLSSLYVLLTETTSSFSSLLRLGGEGDGSSRSLRKILGMSILELSSESSKDILCIWQCCLVFLLFLAYAFLTSFSQGEVIYQIIFNGKESEVLHYRCYNSTSIMENSIACFLKGISKAQTKSMAQMQQQLLSNNNKQTASLLNLNKTHNVTDIKVVSPFYARPGQCRQQNCLCPYHRKLRIKQVPLRKVENRTLQTKTANSSPNEKVRTQIREDFTRETPRMTVQPKLSAKISNPLNWQARKKVDSRNQQFDEFLSQFEQILFKNTKLNPMDLHRIKSSVGEIFKYIYTHLHEEKQVVEEYISKMEKDKDFTHFYMQRFMELKERSLKIKEEKKIRFAKQKTMMTLQSQGESRGRNNSRARTNLYERKDFVKKSIKSRYQKLMAQQFLQDMDCGEEIEEEQVEMFADLDIQNFEENCGFLQKRIKDMDQEMLQDLHNQIVLKAKKKVAIKEASDCRTAKIAALDKLIDSINAKIKMIRQKEGQQQQEYRTGASSHSIKTRGNSVHSNKNRNKKITILGKTNQSAFAKSGFNQIKREDNEDNDFEQFKDFNDIDEDEEKEEKNEGSGRRQSQKAMTLAVEGQQENAPARAVKIGKLQLAKYRKLSHDAFYHKKILGQDQQGLIFSKMKIMTLQDITQQLDNMAFQFAEKKQKLRDIEGKIKDFSLNKYVIHDSDSLITAKRKIRVLKSLLKDEELDYHIKGEMKEYLGLIEQQNYLKNRRWANKKIRNVLQMGLLGEEEVELCEEQADESEKYYFQRLMSQIFGKNSKLIFYQIFKTEYEQKEINFEQHLMEYMKSPVSQEKKQREVKSGRKKIEVSKNKTIVEEQARESDLIQMGLNNKCLSNANYLLNQEKQYQQLYETQYLQEEQPLQLGEDRYLSLFNKLAMLNK